jgi:hypothetical protein
MPSLQTTPVSTTPSYSQTGMVSDNVWREGKLIVLRQGTPLPKRCLQTNETISGPYKKITLYWHSPWLFFLILVHLIIFIIVALAARKSVTLEIAMGPEMLRRKRRLQILGFVIMLSGMIESMIALSQSEPNGTHILVGVLALIVGLFVAAAGSQTLMVQRMEGNYIWLKGASPAYLNSLPEWRGFPPV